MFLWENEVYSALSINAHSEIVYLLSEETALIDLFKEFFPDGLIKMMYDIINEYARQFLSQDSFFKGYSRLKRWKLITSKETCHRHYL